MRTLTIFFATFLAITLTGCAGTPLPPTNHQVEKAAEGTIVMNLY
ncbi:MAG: hypothetical protein AB7J40_01810 [Candidatus Altimarinota bacterium]